MDTKKKMTAKERIVSQHYSEMGKKSAAIRKAKYNFDDMRAIARKGGEAMKAKMLQRQPMKNLDHPENNCKICGYDHALITDQNKPAYGKAHAEYIKKTLNKEAK